MSPVIDAGQEIDLTAHAGHARRRQKNTWIPWCCDKGNAVHIVGLRLARGLGK